jgi:hypothetical protein
LKQNWSVCFLTKLTTEQVTHARTDIDGEDATVENEQGRSETKPVLTLELDDEAVWLGDEHGCRRKKNLVLITVAARGEDDGEADEAPGAPNEAEVGGDEGSHGGDLGQQRSSAPSEIGKGVR